MSIDQIITVCFSVFGFFMAVISFFLKTFYNSVKEQEQENSEKHLHVVEDLGKIKGKIELVEQQYKSDFSRLEQITDFKLTTIQKTLETLSSDVKLLLKK